MPALACDVGSAHLLQGAQTAAMTREQRLRGADGGIDSAIVVSGDDGDAVVAQAHELLVAGGLADHGARDVTLAAYRCTCSLSATAVAA